MVKYFNVTNAGVMPVTTFSSAAVVIIICDDVCCG
jgi:hypothetical protein